MEMTTKTLKIEGMSCGHCVMALKKELSKIEGVEITNASVGRADLAVDETKVTEQKLRDAVAEAGYSLVSVE
jgi:copper chaperone